MFWVDSHCHLQLDTRPPSALIDRADGVAWMLVPGVDVASSRAALDLVDAHPDRVLAAVGLHPHDARRLDSEIGRLEEMVPEAAAVGETGLDFYRNLSPPESQRRSLLAHIELARVFQKPLILHCRDAFAPLHEVIEAAGIGPRCVLHCWTGGPRWTRRFLDLGVTFSFAGPVAFATGDTVRRGAAEVPPDRAMVETDTPYLSPPPFRHEPNEPARVGLVGEALAKVWSLQLGEVADLTMARACEVFGGPPVSDR